MTDSPDLLVQTFMTHRMSDEAILALCTGREKEIKRLKEAFARSLAAAPGPLQHVVIYGPRGFGKSFMVRLMQIEINKLATDDRPLPFVLLPEEQHNLTRNPHALIDYISHKLNDIRTGEDQSWTDAMFQWPDPKQQQALWTQAVKNLELELDQCLGTSKGMAIVVVENFDSLLTSVFKSDEAEQRLRKWLDRRQNRVMFLATATGTVDMDYERPLFQAFQPIRLEPWSQQTCIDYFNRRRATEHKPELDAGLEAKARAVAEFIGGNPRLAQLLSDVLETQDALSVAKTMNALADKLSDYYRRRIDDLPPLAQGLLDALIRGGEPASQTELAKRVGANGQNTIARIMQDLQRGDIIRGKPAPDSREKLYQVIDRVFVHFYRVRQGNQATLKTPLATILDFLRAFYTHDDQKQQAELYYNAGKIAEASVFAGLSNETGQVSTYSVYRDNFERRLNWLAQYCPHAMPAPVSELISQIEQDPESIVENLSHSTSKEPLRKAIETIMSAQALTRLNLLEQAQALLTSRLSEHINLTADILLLDELGYIACWEKHDESFCQTFDIEFMQDIAILPEWLQPLALNIIACRDCIQGDFEHSLSNSRHVASIAKKVNDNWQQSISLQYAAFSLLNLGQHEDAVQTAKQAASLAEKASDISEQAVSLQQAAYSLGELGQHEDAVQTAKQAASLAEKAGAISEQAESLRHAAFSLLQLGQHEDAVQTAKQAASLAKKAGDIRGQAESLRHAAYSLGQLGQHEDAVQTAKQAASLAKKAGDIRGQAESLRHAAFSLGQLGQHEDAVQTAKQAASLAEKAGDIRGQAISLRLAAYSLGELGQHEDAVQTAKQATSLAEKAGDISEQAESLRLAAFSLGRLGQHEDAIQFALKAANLAENTNDEFTLSWSAKEAILAACYVDSPQTIELFQKWMQIDTTKPEKKDIAKWPDYFDELFAATVTAQAWKQLDQLLTNNQALLAKVTIPWLYGDPVGEAIARIANEQGRATGFNVTREILARLLRFYEIINESERKLQSVVSSILTAFAEACSNSNLIRDISGLLIKQPYPDAENHAKLLSALADLDEADNKQTVLARTDPDVARWLRRIRDLPENEE